MHETSTCHALITFDDAGDVSIDAGIRELADGHRDIPLTACYLVENMTRKDKRRAVLFHQDHPNVARAIHWDLCIPDAVLSIAVPSLRRTGALEGFSGSCRTKELLRRQRGRFQEIFQSDPSYGSCHGDWNLGQDGKPYSSFMDSMRELFGEQVSLISGEDGMEVIRHYRFRAAVRRLFGQGNPPMAPNQFQKVLLSYAQRGVRLVDFVSHPALSEHPLIDTLRFRELYAPPMRHADLAGTQEILRSRVIQTAGFSIVSPDQIIDERHV